MFGMFVTKFIVPVTRKFHNNVARFSPHKTRCNNKAIGEKSQSGNKITSSKCKEYQEKLARCPKPSHESLCCKPLFSKSRPEVKDCKVKLVVENYEKLYKDITTQAKSVLKTIQDKSKSILDGLQNDIQGGKSADKAQVRELSQKIKERIEEILTLDPSHGSLKRKCAMSLNYQVHQALNDLQCDVVPKVTKLTEILVILERDVLICIDRARSLILTCRKCNDPQGLSKCLEENGDQAKQILDETLEGAQVCLRKAEALKQETLLCHRTAVAEVLETHSKKHKLFLQNLDKCIAVIKFINKQ